jgi:hypothetical protein
MVQGIGDGVQDEGELGQATHGLYAGTGIILGKALYIE